MKENNERKEVRIKTEISPFYFYFLVKSLVKIIPKFTSIYNTHTYVCVYRYVYIMGFVFSLFMKLVYITYTILQLASFDTGTCY